MADDSKRLRFRFGLIIIFDFIRTLALFKHYLIDMLGKYYEDEVFLASVIIKISLYAIKTLIFFRFSRHVRYCIELTFIEFYNA